MKGGHVEEARPSEDSYISIDKYNNKFKRIGSKYAVNPPHARLIKVDGEKDNNSYNYDPNNIYYYEPDKRKYYTIKKYGLGRFGFKRNIFVEKNLSDLSEQTQQKQDSEQSTGGKRRTRRRRQRSNKKRTNKRKKTKTRMKRRKTSKRNTNKRRRKR